MMATKAGALTEFFPNATMLSEDGVNACDIMLRKAMLKGLSKIAICEHVLCGTVKVPLGGDFGTVHTINPGEGGGQGDALMPLLYSLGQHGALHKLHSEELREEETLLASWMTHMWSFRVLTKRKLSTQRCRRQCSAEQTFASTQRNRRSGMQQGSNRQDVVCCSALPRRTIPQRWCREDASCPRTNKG